MQIIVTGGAGFIGTNFLRTFAPRFPEHQFVNVDKFTYAANPANLQDLEGGNYLVEQVDVADADAVMTVFERHQPDVVVHFAAESHVDRSISGPAEFVRTNVQGTFCLLEAARRHWLAGKKNGLFHHVSTDEVYGSLGPNGLFVETTRYDPSSPYSATKASSDHLVRAYARTYGLRTRITNCSNNYGPYQFPEKLIPLMVLNALERKSLPVYGKGVNVRDWLYVEDHCEAIWSVLENGADGETYNVGGSAERRNIDVVTQICDIVADETNADREELRRLLTFVPDRPGHDLRYAIDATKITRECGWHPKETFESGLRRTVRWYIDNPRWVEQVRTGAYRQWIEHNYGDRGNANHDKENAT